MQVKSFGTLLTVIGIFFIFVCFVFSDWSPELNFIENIRYATLIELSPQVGYFGSYSGNYEPASVITLGQGLLLPIFIVCVGIIFNREVFDSQSIKRLLPFLKD